MSMLKGFSIPGSRDSLLKRGLSEGKLEHFLKTERFPMSIIDLNYREEDEHKIVARYVEEKLCQGSTTWVIHLFCYNVSDRVTSLALSIILRRGILSKLPKLKPSSLYEKDWGICKIDPSMTADLTEYEFIMMMVANLISEVLKELPKRTIHFIFSGLRPSTMTNNEQRDGLTRFMLEMADMVKTISGDRDDDRMIKCVFCGDGLFDSLGLVRLLEEEGQTLMLKWEPAKSVWLVKPTDL